ncbi:MAG: hypothetical protein ACI9SB_003033 [Candidatus Azotimanducaceae bacterium]|jgi:hypothetical protein
MTAHDVNIPISINKHALKMATGREPYHYLSGLIERLPTTNLIDCEALMSWHHQVSNSSRTRDGTTPAQRLNARRKFATSPYPNKYPISATGNTVPNKYSRASR